MKKLKKSVSVILSLVMVLGMLAIVPLGVSAATIYYSDEGTPCSFNAQTGKLILHAGTYTDPAFQNDGDIISVTAEDGVKLVGDCSGMFYSCGNCTSIDLSKADTSAVTDMSGMFYICTSLKSVNLEGIDTSAVTDMQEMFRQCRALETLDLGSFVTSNVSNMAFMFENCVKLKSVDLSSFDTSNVVYMNSMFAMCKSLEELDLSTFDTSKVQAMSNMFYFAEESDCSLKTVYVGSGWTTSKVSASSGMFQNCAVIKGGNGTAYDSSKTDKTYARVDKGGTKGYFTESDKCIVKWMNGEELLFMKSVRIGDSPLYADSGLALPEKPSTDEYDYEFSGWSPQEGTISQDTTYLAQFDEIRRMYKVNAADIAGGTVTADADEAGKGDTVTVTVTPNEGYVSGGVYYAYSPDAEERYEITGSQFTMPAQDVYLTADFDFSDNMSAKVAGHSICLDGDIGVKFHMDLSDSVVNSENDPYVRFTVPGAGQDYSEQIVYLNSSESDPDRETAVKDNSQEQNRYIFKCSVPAKNMSTVLTAQLVDGDNAGSEFHYSVTEYADYLLANAYYDEEHQSVKNQAYADAYDLVEAMVAYGEYARVYFDEAIEDTEPAGFDSQIPETEYSTSNDFVEGVFNGATLSLKAKTTLSLYFKSSKELTVEAQGYVCETVHKGDDYVIRIRGIAANKLNEDIIVSVSDGENDGTISYSPLAYCCIVANSDKYSNKLKNTVNALYAYHIEAVKYFA